MSSPSDKYWAFARDRETAELWEWVAYACRLDLGSAKRILTAERDEKRGRIGDIVLSQEELQAKDDYLSRLEVAKSALGRSLHPVSHTSSQEWAPVKTSTFWAWARGKGWEVPSGIATPSNPTAPRELRTPNAEDWRPYRDVELWKAVALLVGIDPRSLIPNPQSWMGDDLLFTNETSEFRGRMEIALSCRKDLGCYSRTDLVDLPQFFLWAARKGLPGADKWVAIFPAEEAKNTEGKEQDGDVKLIAGLRKLIRECGGPTLGDDAAVRNFAYSAGIMVKGDNPKGLRLSWNRAAIEPAIRAEIAKRKAKDEHS